jgi:flagellar protein FliO/FliZ
MFGYALPRRRPRGGCRRNLSSPRLAALCLLAALAGALPISAQQVAPAPASSGELTPVGQGATADEAAPARVSLVSTWDFVRMLLVLAAVIAFIYIVFVLLRRGTRRATAQNDLIRVLGSKSLAGNRSLHLVRVARSLYLVGSAEASVALVSEIRDKESVDEILLEAEKQRAPGRRTFSDILAGLVPHGAGGQLALPDGLGFVRRQRERLRKLRSV